MLYSFSEYQSHFTSCTSLQHSNCSRTKRDRQRGREQGSGLVLPCLCLLVVALVGEQVAQAQAPCNVVISSPASGSQWTIGQPVSVSAGLNGHQTISPSFVKVDSTQVCTLSASNPSCLTTVNGLGLGSHNATWAAAEVRQVAITLAWFQKRYLAMSIRST
jgi:hypothetical protein